MTKGRKIRRTRKKNIFAQFCLMTVFCVLMSAGIAYGWQSIEDKTRENEEPPFVPSEHSALEENNVAEEKSHSSEESENNDVSVSDETSQESEESSEISQTEEIKYGLVEKQERVKSSYFDDAVFIGDSITTGIALYDIMPNSTVLADTGINLQSIMTKEVIKDKETGTKLTIPDALKKTEAKKIYIMLGANGLAFLGPETTMELYETFVNKIKGIKPEAIIYVQSIFPIDEAKFAQRYKGNLTNDTIDATNELLVEMAERLEVYYVNPAEIFKDENGGLMSEVTPDGLHFNSEYYTKWMDYLKTHALSKI